VVLLQSRVNVYDNYTPNAVRARLKLQNAAKTKTCALMFVWLRRFRVRVDGQRGWHGDNAD
jgi:hypothetical protein